MMTTIEPSTKIAVLGKDHKNKLLQIWQDRLGTSDILDALVYFDIKELISAVELGQLQTVLFWDLNSVNLGICDHLLLHETLAELEMDFYYHLQNISSLTHTKPECKFVLQIFLAMKDFNQAIHQKGTSDE